MANIWTIAEDIRARLNAIEERKPDDSHPNGLSSLLDERQALRELERILDRKGY